MRITLIVLLLFAASAVADDVILKDGRVLSGKVVDEGKRYTVVDRDRKFAVRKLEVARVFSKPSFMDDYEARLEKLPFDDAEAIFEFGRWLAENEWASRAARAYEEVLELDPDHRGARRALGYKLYEGEWVGPEELNRRKGLVKFEGRWYTKHDLQLKKEIENNEKLRQAVEHRRRENLKINRIVTKFATFDKKQRRKAYDELYQYAETLNSPELRKFADDTKAYFDERARVLCAQMMARTEIQATRTKLKRPIENFVTNLGAAIAFISAQNPVTIQLPEIEMVQIQTTADIPAGCK
ncbi:MAG: hypothetical protein ACYTG3_08275 [Planctomycetota bacterium]|jgi:hypothetical protein